MPQSTTLTMASQDSDGPNDTPDRSLGSLSLSATGEQLDDIQVNLDHMYMESPAPSSLLPNDRMVTSVNLGGGTFAVRRNRPIVSTSGDLDSFDRLSLIDVSEFAEAIEDIDWLAPPNLDVPATFTEDDRSFLDTSLMNKRFSLLNYVTRAISEESYADLRKVSSPSATSNLSNEAAGSGATIKINRPYLGKTGTSATITRNGTVCGRGYSIHDAFNNDPDPGQDNFEDVNMTSSANHSQVPVQDDPLDDGTSQASGISPISADFKTILLRRRTPHEGSDIGGSNKNSPYSMDPRNPASNGDATVFNSTNSNISPGGRPNPANNSSTAGMSYAAQEVSGFGDVNLVPSSNRINSATLKRLEMTGFSIGGATDIQNTTYLADESALSSGNEESGFVPEDLSPIAKTKAHPSLLNGLPRARENNGFGGAGGDPRRSSIDETSNSSGSFSREIDTRTYTRPKKTRMSIATPNRQLNTTMELSPHRRLSSASDTSPQRQLNTTIDLAHDKNGIGAAGLSPMNLNETFVTPGEDITDSIADRARRVTRNLSYVVRKDEESPNNNSSPQHSAGVSRLDLNSTFTHDPDADQDGAMPRESQNTSMEDLNSRVASQIRSLGCSTISRGRLSDQAPSRTVSTLEDARLVARTSSADTYSVAQSSESPTSSGLSSPMDAQSYDDIQSGEAVRRSMPNLAVMRSAQTMRSGLAFPQAGGGQLRKNHYISDSRLSRLGSTDRPKLTVHPAESPHNLGFNQGHLTGVGRSRGADRNTSTPSLNRPMTSGASRVYSAHTLGSSNTRSGRPDPSAGKAQSSMGNVRSTGLHQPRFSSASSVTAGGFRPPRPTTSGQSGPRSTVGQGIPVANFRTQSRIPAPGQLRFSRPPQSQTFTRTTRPSAQKGPAVDDWRDGCY